MSPSITSTRLPFSATARARFIVINDFPEPGLNDVTAMTLAPSVGVRINSTFVRNTRNASFITSRRPSFTTRLLTSFKPFLAELSAPVSERGISPRKGRVRCSMSRRPRMRVLEF